MLLTTAVSDWSPDAAVKIDDAGGMIEPHYVSHLSALGSATLGSRHRGTMHRVHYGFSRNNRICPNAGHAAAEFMNGTRDATAGVDSVRDRGPDLMIVTLSSLPEYRKSARIAAAAGCTGFAV